jgi:hypothetical protein
MWGFRSVLFVQEHQRDSCRVRRSVVGMDNQHSIGCSDLIPVQFRHWRQHFGYAMSGVEFAPFAENTDNMKTGGFQYHARLFASGIPVSINLFSENSTRFGF